MNARYWLKRVELYEPNVANFGPNGYEYGGGNASSLIADSWTSSVLVAR